MKQPVDVIRDEWGVPHIYAQNTEDLFFAQGYVMAQDRLWEMEWWRRELEGRVAEVLGPSAFERDRLARLLKYRGPFDDSEWTSYHADGKQILTAYANGINAYITSHADHLPVEFVLTGIKPLPWTAETVALREPAFGNATSELRLAMDVAKYGVKEANRRAAPDPWDDLQVPEGLDVKLVTDATVEISPALTLRMRQLPRPEPPGGFPAPRLPRPIVVSRRRRRRGSSCPLTPSASRAATIGWLEVPFPQPESRSSRMIRTALSRIRLFATSCI